MKNIHSKETLRAIGTILKPSWLSGLVAITIGLIVVAGAVVVFAFNDSSVQQQLVSWEQSRPQRALTPAGQTVPEDDHPTITSTWPLMVVWGFVGLLVYFITMAIVHAVSEARKLEESLDYVNADPHAIIERALGHLVLRVISAVFLIAFSVLFIEHVLPYGIKSAHAASDTPNATNFFYAMLAILVIAFTVQVQTVFLRLCLGKSRAV